MALSLISSENFDASSSLPSGWTFGAKWTISTAQKVSGTRSAFFQAGTSGNWFSGAYGTADGNSGDCQVSANIYLNTPSVIAGVYLRAAAYPLSYSPGSTGTFYMVQLTPGNLTVSRVVAGATSTIATINSAGIVTGGWFNVQFACQGAAGAVVQTCQLTRLSDNFQMNGFGIFGGIGIGNCYAGTDTSGIGGSGYAGVIGNGQPAIFDSAYYDDFLYYKILSASNQKMLPKILVGRYDTGRYQNADYI